MQTYNLTTPQQNIYNETKFYSDTALGILFGFLFVRSESIYLSLVVHFVFNLIGFIYSLLSAYLSRDAIETVNLVSLVLMILSAVGAPFMIWLIFRDFEEI